jgi:hypothetical protein
MHKQDQTGQKWNRVQAIESKWNEINGGTDGVIAVVTNIHLRVH